MMTYTVVKGDTLTKIAFKFQTTVAIILGDNPSIANKDKIKVGQKIKIQSVEQFAKSKTVQAKADKGKATKIKLDKTPQLTGVTTTKSTIKWGDLTIKDNQIGVVTLKKDANLYTFDANGKIKYLRTAKKGDRFRVYGTIPNEGGMLSVGGSYIKKNDVSFEAIPSHLDATNTKPGTVTDTPSATGNNSNKVNKTPTATKQNDNAVVGGKGSDKSPKDATIPQFDMPGYRRTRMQVKKKDGKLLVMELRLTGFSTSHSNHYSPSKTNAGWAVHVGGKNLTNIGMEGFLLDSKSNREADDFLNNYNSQLTPRSSDKYFNAALVVLIHKNREYKGLISAVSIQDNSANPIDRKFSLQFLVMQEKSLTFSQANDNYSYTIFRKGVGELPFSRELSNMLKNPITGK